MPVQGVAVGGGFRPAFGSDEQALDSLLRAIERAGFTPGDEIAILVDTAATDFGRGGRYRTGSRPYIPCADQEDPDFLALGYPSR